MVHRTKLQIALELYDRAMANGIVFEWLTFDEGYGKSVAFLEALRRRGQKFVAEVSVTFTGWNSPPQVASDEPPGPQGGRPRTRPRLEPGSAHFLSVVEHLQQSPELRDQPWQAWHVKDGEKGLMVWEAKQVWFYPNGEQNVPLAPLHLMVARSVLEPAKLKFFVAAAPRETPLKVLLLVAFTRWRVERCFEDQKTELGFDHFEGRSYVGLMRHQIVTALTHLFLSRTHQEWRGEKSGVDRVPGSHSGRGLGTKLVAHEPGLASVFGTHGGHH